MKLRYIYSACVEIETPDIRVLSDPWFTQGAEYGSWFHYPPLPDDPINIIGKVDVIYISHLHTDHYDPVFLKQYLSVYPETEIIICPMRQNQLERRMITDGFEPIVTEKRTYNNTNLYLVENKGYAYDFDTALLTTHGDQSILNLNDNRIDKKQLETFKALCPGGRPTLALLTYAGAGPYPQTYFFKNQQERIIAEKRKKRQFLEMYQSFCNILEPVRAMPFAGSYVLGGPLSKLNAHRGMADATEVTQLEKCGEISIVLDDGGAATFDLDTLQASALRVKPYLQEDIKKYTQTIDFDGYHYQKEFKPMGDKPLSLIKLCKSVYGATISRFNTEQEWWICLKPTGSPYYLVFNTAKDRGVEKLDTVDHINKRWEIHADDKLLFLLLSGYYHWGNAEGGSHLECKRVPNEYVEEVHDFLYFLMI